MKQTAQQLQCPANAGGFSPLKPQRNHQTRALGFILSRWKKQQQPNATSQQQQQPIPNTAATTAGRTHAPFDGKCSVMAAFLSFVSFLSNCIGEKPQHTTRTTPSLQNTLYSSCFGHKTQSKNACQRMNLDINGSCTNQAISLMTI